MKIGIFDTGVNLLHSELIDKNIICKSFNDGLVREEQGNTDCIGHGTAICGIITQHDPAANITVYRLFENSEYIDEYKFIEVLKYVSLYEKFDILCLCLGISATARMVELENICNDIVGKGTVIVASFNNIGVMTYPAVFETVIGVDWDIACKKNNDIIYCKEGFVNVYAKGMNQRLCWSGKADYIINSGASFAAAHVAGILSSNEMKFANWGYDQAIEFIEKYALKKVEVTANSRLERYNKKRYGRIAVFPFNKEIKAILRFAEYVQGNVVNVFDIRQSGKIGKKISEDDYLSNIEGDYVIKNIEDIFLSVDDIDTLVIGHLEQINKVTQKNYTEFCIDYCLENKKNFVSFDTLLPSIKSKFSYENIECYSMNVEDIHYDPSEKLFSIGKPVVSVMGTSAQQGKFTLQMELRKKLELYGYKVGQWSSEPQGAILNADQVFPTGYGSNINFAEKQIVNFINYQLHDIEKKDPDIIISGTQSFVLWEKMYNTHTYPILQSAIIAGLNPDAIVLIVNCFDDTSYILRTIRYLESWTNAEVVCVVLSFKKSISTWSPTEVRQTEMISSEVNDCLFQLSKITSKPCFYIDDIDKIIHELITFFS